jgi:hypothetical protein
MAVANHCMRYRPLRGGVVIVAGARNHYGTLGMILTSDGRDRWGLTCAHVLGPVGGPVPEGDPVFQPDTSQPSLVVGRTTAAMADPHMDAAAFHVHGDVGTAAEILGMGRVASPVEPAVGMRVVKSGRSTGVTEGAVTAVVGDEVKIGVPGDLPPGYDLSDPGDSGAVWCTVDGRAPVALHRAGSDGAASAIAIRLTAVLRRFALRPL